MGTSIRPEIWKKNEYWISRHRYYELKHFCLQYPEWKREYAAQNGGAEQREQLKKWMDMVETAAGEAADDLGEMMLRAVTEGLSYVSLSPPCCKEVWYAAYRRFFWILNGMRK